MVSNGKNNVEAPSHYYVVLPTHNDMHLPYTVFNLVYQLK